MSDSDLTVDFEFLADCERELGLLPGGQHHHDDLGDLSLAHPARHPRRVPPRAPRRSGSDRRGDGGTGRLRADAPTSRDGPLTGAAWGGFKR